MTGSKIQLEVETLHAGLYYSGQAVSQQIHSVNGLFRDIDDRLLGIGESVAHNNNSISKLADILEHLVIHDSRPLSPVLSTTNALKDLPTPEASVLSTTSGSSLPIGDPTPKRTLSEKIAQSHGIFSIWATYRHRTCPDSCPCDCHHSNAARSKAWKTPDYVRRLMGSIFGTYTGLPTWSRGYECNSVVCHRQYSRTVEVAYDFPLWFLNWNIHALIHFGSAGSPSLSLFFRQRVPYMLNGIFHAVDSNNLELAEAILKRDPDWINHRLYKNGHTPLHLASLRPGKISFRMFQLLLRAGADLNTEADSGRSAGSYIAGQMLLGGFPDVHTAEFTKWATISHFMDALELSPATEVAVGLRVGDISSMLRRLPSTHLKLDEFDNTGSTPLYWAAKAGNLGAIKALVGYGVDVNQKNVLGNNAILGSFAFKRGLDCLNWLLEHGGDPYLLNNDGHNAFTLACYLGRLDVVKHLIAWGVSVDCRDGKNRTGLSCAVLYDHDHLVQYLCSIGADVDAVGEQGFVPIFDAARANAHRCLRFLLRTKVNYRFCSRSGWTILHQVGVSGDAETMAILAEHGLRGVDVSARTAGGGTAEAFFVGRPSLISHPLLEAFEHLLRVVEQETNVQKRELEAETEKDALELYFDAVEYPEVEEKR